MPGETGLTAVQLNLWFKSYRGKKSTAFSYCLNSTQVVYRDVSADVPCLKLDWGWVSIDTYLNWGSGLCYFQFRAILKERHVQIRIMREEEFSEKTILMDRQTKRILV